MANELRQLVDTANAPSKYNHFLTIRMNFEVFVISNFESIVIVFGIDVKGNVNEWNEKTAEITGFSKDEAFNKPLGEVYTVR